MSCVSKNKSNDSNQSDHHGGQVLFTSRTVLSSNKQIKRISFFQQKVLFVVMIQALQSLYNSSFIEDKNQSINKNGVLSNFLHVV